MVQGSVHRLLVLAVFLGCNAPSGREPLVLRIAMWGPLGELAPTRSESALASVAQPWVFERLVTVDAEGQLKPALAARVDRLSVDRMRVELRRDVTFSDGAPITEADTIRSLESGGLKVTQSDGALFVESSQRGLPVDALLLEARVYRESGGKFIGSGPFMVASQTETEIRLTRRTPRAGKINEVRVVAYATPRDAFAHTLKGDTNLIIDLEPRWLEFFRGVPSFQVIRRATRSTDAILFNRSLLRTERLQLARALASQRVRDLAYGPAECAESREVDDADPGLGPGPVLRVLSWGPFERLGLAVHRALGDRAGDLSHLSPQETVSRMKSADFDLVMARPIRWPRSSMALIWRTGSANNIIGYSNPAVDHAIEAGDWDAAEAALQEDPPAAFVCTRDHVAVLDVRIKNPSLGPYDVLEALPDWEVAQ